LLTSYGISDITICSFPLFLTNSVLALTIIFPRPVLKASIIPSFPSTMAPVGKSGPLTISIMSSNVQLGFFILFTVASIISLRLCGGILVAYPALIPLEPFTSKLGKRAGKTVGSINVSS